MFSFTKNKKKTELAPKIRRLCDVTTNNCSSPGDTKRVDDRYFRTIPTLLCRWEHGSPVEDEWAIVLTRDLADHGLSLILVTPVDIDELVVGFWPSQADMNEPWFFIGRQRNIRPIGGGFWTMGVELTEFANEEYRCQLRALLPLAEKLLPQQAAVAAQ